MTCLGVTSASFSALNSLWNDLLSRHTSGNIFLTREWQEAWWNEFGNDADLRLLTIGAPDSPLGIAPMQLQGDRLSFLGETDLFDYHDFIPADPAFYPVPLRLHRERAVAHARPRLRARMVADVRSAAAGRCRARLRRHRRTGGRGAWRHAGRFVGRLSGGACARRTGTSFGGSCAGSNRRASSRCV